MLVHRLSDFRELSTGCVEDLWMPEGFIPEAV